MVTAVGSPVLVTAVGSPVLVVPVGAACAVAPITVEFSRAAACCCWATSRARAWAASKACRAASSAWSCWISPLIDESSRCRSERPFSISALADARADTTRSWAWRACRSAVPRVATSCRYCRTCRSTCASCAEIRLAVSMRLMMSSRLCAPRMTCTIGSAWPLMYSSRNLLASRDSACALFLSATFIS